MKNGGGFIFIDSEGKTGYINPYANEECYVRI